MSVLALAVMLVALAGARRSLRADRALRQRVGLGQRRPAPSRRARHVPRVFAQACHRSAVPVPASTAWAAALVAPIALGLIGAALGGPGLAIIGATVAVAASAGCLAATSGRRSARITASLPSFLDGVAARLRSGENLAPALLSAPASGELGVELARLRDHLASGSTAADALAEWRSTTDVPMARLAASGLLLGAAHGGQLARAAEGVALTCRERVALAAEVRAHSAQARLSALVIAAAPIAFALLAASADPRVVHTLTATPLGLLCLAGGLGLDAAGLWWMHRLVGSIG